LLGIRQLSLLLNSNVFLFLAQTSRLLAFASAVQDNPFFLGEGHRHASERNFLRAFSQEASAFPEKPRKKLETFYIGSEAICPAHH